MKKIISFICILTMIFSCAPTLVYAKTYDPSLVVTYAKSLVGNSYESGYCLRFVKECFEHEYSFTSSACCAHNYSESYTDSTSMNNIPVGADVFFKGSGTTCSKCSSKAGHIGIYIGDGYMVHAMSGKVRKDKVSDIDAYNSLDFVGWGWHGNKSFETSVPSTPTIKSCKANGTTSITISWDTVSGATKYRIQGHKQGDEYSTLTESCTSTSYTATGLKAGSKYYFRVASINSAGTSKNSTVYAVYTKPSAPTNVSISQDSDSQLTLTWNAVSGVSRYRVEYGIANDSTRDFPERYSQITTNSFVHKGLDSGTKYYYRVTAIIDGEEGLEGSRKDSLILSDHSSTVVKFTKISEPEISLNSSGNAVMKWSSVVGDSSYEYKVYRTTPGNTNSTLLTTTSSKSYTDSSASSGYIYKYKISAVNKGETKQVVACDSFYAGHKITSGITLTPASATSMKISWTKPKSAISLKYGIYRKSGSTYKLIKTTTDTSYTESGLTSGTTYQYYVQVLDSLGNYLTEYADNSAKLEILPTGVSLSKSEAVITAGDNLSLTATVSPSSCTDTSVSWSSSNESVATVSSNGVITAVAEGTAVITVTTTNSKTAKCNITVQSAECSHNYVTTRTEATCEEDGIIESICSLCGDTVIEIIPVTGHSYSDEWTVITESNCAEEGEQAHICTVCGAEADNMPIDKTDHSFGEWITETEATCSESGSIYRICSVCGETETEITDALGHSYALTNDEAPTLDGPGTRTYTCENCSDSYDESYTIVVEAGIFQVESYAPSPGETFTIPVTISENPGIAGFNFIITYDESAMTPTEITAGELITSGTFTSNLEQGIPADELEVVTAYWSDAENITDDGTLFYITFETDSSATGDEYKVSLDYNMGDIGSVADGYLQDIMPEVVSGTITMSDVIRGDVNLDRSVNSFDIILLARYLAHWNVSLNDNQVLAADVYKDNVLNSKDTIRLAQLLAGFEPEDNEASTVSLASAVYLLSISNDSNSDTKISVESINGIAGEYISIPVKIENNPGIAAAEIVLNYDSDYLTPVGIDAGIILQNGQFVSNLEESEDISELEYITAVWNNYENMTDDGTLFTLEFLISDDVVVGQQLNIEIDCDDTTVCDQNLNDVDADVIQGCIDIIEYEEENLYWDDETLQYYINGVSLMLDDETSCYTIPENKDFSLTVNFECTEDEKVSAVIVIAEYDTDGRLLDSIFEDITDEILDEGIYEAYISQSNADIDKIKVYIWDSLEGMQPLSEVIEIS